MINEIKPNSDFQAIIGKIKNVVQGGLGLQLSEKEILSLFPKFIL